MIGDELNASPRRTLDPGDSHSYRTLMGRFATGVTVITYDSAGAPAGLTANGFLSVSMQPPLVLVSVRRESRFARHIRIGLRYGVNFLAERQQRLSMHFGGRTDADLQPEYWYHDGLPMLEHCLGYVIAEVVDVHPAGDHLLFVGKIHHLELGDDAAPLLFFGGRYKRLQAHMPANYLFDSFGDGW